MSYIKSSLDEDEQVVYQGHLSSAWLFTWIIFGLILCLVGIGPFVILYVVLKYYSTEIAVTNSRFIFKTGFVARQVNEVALRKIEGVSLSQGVIGRILGYGTVQVRGTGSDRVNVRLINDPMKLRSKVSLAADQAEMAIRSSAPPNTRVLDT